MATTAYCAGWSVNMDSPIDRSTISVHTGFPNAAEDSRLHALDLNSLLIKNPNSTFFFTITGNDWEKLGIYDQDIALVDRVLLPKKNDLVIWVHQDTFAISRCKTTPDNAELWGVVTAIIHPTRKSHVRAH